MPLTIPTLETYPFQTDLSVRIQNINYGNHLGHDQLISLLHEARLRFLAQHGFSEMDAGGAGLIVSELACTYLAEVRYGDGLTVEVGFANPARVRCDSLYRVTRRSDETVVALAQVGLVFFDYQARQVAALPAAFRAAAGLNS